MAYIQGIFICMCIYKTPRQNVPLSLAASPICFDSDAGKKFPHTVPIFEGPCKCVIVFKHNQFVN